MTARTLWMTLTGFLALTLAQSGLEAQVPKSAVGQQGAKDGKDARRSDQSRRKNETTDSATDEEGELEIDPAATNLDAVQREKLSRVRVMVTKLYGHPDVPEEAKQEVRDTVFAALDGSHRPERDKVDVVSNELMESLKERRLSVQASYSILEQTAELMGAETLSREAYEGLQREIQRRTATSRLGTDGSEQLLAHFNELVQTATRNEEKIEKRQLARAEEERKLEEERLAKEEEERKREERKSKAKSRGNKSPNRPNR